MKRFLIIIALAGTAVLVGQQFGAHNRPRRTGFAGVRHKMMKRMMAAMPEDSPPKLIISILPRLKEQNEQILALLEEQRDLLRRLAEKQEAE
jgi:hypothetical protein